MNVIWQEFQETIDKLIDVTICFLLELKQMKCYCVSKKNFFWDHVTINWRKNITACLRTMINYTCLTYPSVLCDVSHLQFYQDLNKHKSLKNICLCICKKNAWIWKVVLQWNSCLRLIFVLSYYAHVFC